MSETDEQRKYRLARGKRIRSYGITLQEHDRLMAEQNNCCWICKGNNDQMALCIDHDHKTGEVRGLLCNVCNRAIGLLRDDPDLIKRAAEYLINGVPDYLQGKLIMRHGVKTRVPLDYVQPDIIVSIETDWYEVMQEQHKATYGHRLEDCNGRRKYNRRGILMDIIHEL
jgi:hypothetical protein